MSSHLVVVQNEFVLKLKLINKTRLVNNVPLAYFSGGVF